MTGPADEGARLDVGGIEAGSVVEMSPLAEEGHIVVAAVAAAVVAANVYGS